jgi:RNA polymerase sigma factor (sigma-70 family)
MLKPGLSGWGITMTTDLRPAAVRAARRSSEMPMDDAALVEALRSGNPQAPRLLIERYQGIVFGLCYRMMNHQQDAEDVVQETFVRALRSIAGFDAARPMRPWLLEIAANRCRSALARRTRRPLMTLSDPADDVADPRAGPADPDDVAGELERALSRLRPEYRLVFVLFHEQNLSYDEIARAVMRPVGTIKTWLHRARAELAEYLSGRGIVGSRQ